MPFFFICATKLLALKPKKVPTFHGEQFFGKIICSFWVPAKEHSKVALCYFIVQYTFEGVTYQQKYLDHAYGLLATVIHVDLIVDPRNPREAILALSNESLYRCNHNADTIKNQFGAILSCFVVIFLFVFAALPLAIIPAECKAYNLEFSVTMLIDAVLHHILVLGLVPLQSHLVNDSKKKNQACTSAIVLNTIEKPFVPETNDRVVDHSLYYQTPSSKYCSHLYLSAGCICFMIWMMYASFECGISGVYCLYMAILTVWLTNAVVDIMMDYLQLESECAKYRKEGIFPKNVTVIKSGSPACNPTSIIQYEVDSSSIDGTTKTVMVQAWIKSGDEHEICILPSDPITVFVMPEALPPKDWQTIVKLLVSPFGVISFYTWKGNAGFWDNCMFAIITGTLCFFYLFVYQNVQGFYCA